MIYRWMLFTFMWTIFKKALNCDGEEKDDSTENSEVIKADNEESVTLSDGD